MPLDAADGGRTNSPQPRLNFQLRFLPAPDKKKSEWCKNARACSREFSAEKSGKKTCHRDISRNARRVISLTSLKDNRGYSSSVIRLPKRPVSSSQRPFTRALVISGSREKTVGCRQPPPTESTTSRISPGFSRSFASRIPSGSGKRWGWWRMSRGIRTVDKVTEIEIWKIHSNIFCKRTFRDVTFRTLNPLLVPQISLSFQLLWGLRDLIFKKGIRSLPYPTLW